MSSVSRDADGSIGVTAVAALLSLENFADSDAGRAEVRLAGQRLLVFNKSVVGAAFVEKNLSDIVVGFGKIRHQRRGAGKMLQRGVGVPQAQENIPQIVVGESIVGLELESFFIRADGLGNLVCLEESEPQVAPGFGLVGFDRQRFLKRVGGVGKFALAQTDFSNDTLGDRIAGKSIQNLAAMSDGVVISTDLQVPFAQVVVGGKAIGLGAKGGGPKRFGVPVNVDVAPGQQGACARRDAAADGHEAAKNRVRRGQVVQSPCNHDPDSGGGNVAETVGDKLP